MNVLVFALLGALFFSCSAQKSVYSRVCQNPAFLDDKPEICVKYCNLVEQPWCTPELEHHLKGCTKEQEIQYKERREEALQACLALLPPDEPPPKPTNGETKADNQETKNESQNPRSNPEPVPDVQNGENCPPGPSTPTDPQNHQNEPNQEPNLSLILPLFNQIIVAFFTDPTNILYISGILFLPIFLFQYLFYLIFLAPLLKTNQKLLSQLEKLLEEKNKDSTPKKTMTRCSRADRRISIPEPTTARGAIMVVDESLLQEQI